MTTYPRKSKLFQAWAKAMVAGATVDKPTYSMKRSSRPKRAKQRAFKRRKRNNAKKE